MAATNFQPSLDILWQFFISLVFVFTSIVESTLRSSTARENSVTHGHQLLIQQDLSREKSEESNTPLLESDREHKLIGTIYHDEKNETQ